MTNITNEATAKKAIRENTTIVVDGGPTWERTAGNRWRNLKTGKPRTDAGLFRVVLGYVHNWEVYAWGGFGV